MFGDMERTEQYNSTPTLFRLQKLVLEMQQLAPMISSHGVEQLRDSLTDLPSKLSSDDCLQAWKLSYSIWNWCVEIANNLQPGQKLEEDHAKLRQIASDLLFLAQDIEGVDSSLLKIATFFHRTGIIWHQLQAFESAASCFEQATELASKFQDGQERTGTPTSREDHEFMFDLLVARSNTAWELSHKALACSLLARARGLLVMLPERNFLLAENYFEYGKSMLTTEDIECQADAIRYLEQAYEIISLRSGAGNSQENDRGITESLKISILRYLAAGHLQRENYESVLKCVVVLKSAPEHPSTSYLAVKALAGLGRFEEAERELFVLIRQPDANIEACMSAIEILLQDRNRLEAGKRAFLSLRSHHPSNKGLPVRILEYLLRRLPYLDVYNERGLDVVVAIASKEDIVKSLAVHEGLVLDSGSFSSKEQECVHALLWNSGSEHFQAKQYEACIKLFETSMLYLPPDLVLLRAKSFRVLCLCRLALQQYDRAAEYIIEAEKIEPNIACAFLKFKIQLQTSNEVEAAKQVEKMLACPDFEPEYLKLASHEAMAYDCYKVATSALSKYLSLPQSKRSTDAKEVVVIRNIIHITLQDPNHSKEALLRYLKEAQVRLADLGSDAFFGSGNLGQEEANWFASTSWNQGLCVIKTQEWQLAADYFSCASDFYGSLPESRENLLYIQKSLLLATSSLLASEAGDDCVRSASRMLDKCRKVQSALAMSQDPTQSLEPTQMTEDSCEIHLNLLAFDVKCRSKDYKSQIDILYHCSSLPGFNANHYLMLASQASKSAGGSAEVVSTAYRLALKLFLSSTSPDYESVAKILRKQVTLIDQHRKDGPEVLAVYKQAKEILAGLGSGEYPLEELQWLVATSWNRAGLHVKFLRFSEAEAWMEIALGLANYVPNMETGKSWMIESLNQVREQKQSPQAISDGHKMERKNLQTDSIEIDPQLLNDHPLNLKSSR